jgi:hypothetical protein
MVWLRLLFLLPFVAAVCRLAAFIFSNVGMGLRHPVIRVQHIRLEEHSAKGAISCIRCTRYIGLPTHPSAEYRFIIDHKQKRQIEVADVYTL